MASKFDFVNVAVADRDLVVTSADDHACRVEPRESDLAWFCDVDDGTPASNENDPAPHGEGEVRPAELWSITSTREGVVVLSVSWWDRAPAPDHHIGLAVDVAGRLSAQQADQARRPRL